jgi:hypothetical protein
MTQASATQCRWGLEFCRKRFEVAAVDGGVMQVPESFAGGDCFDCLAQTFRARSVRIFIGVARFFSKIIRNSSTIWNSKSGM